MSVLKGMTYTITTCSIAASPVLLDVILVIMAVTTSFKHIYDGLVSLTGA